MNSITSLLAVIARNGLLPLETTDRARHLLWSVDRMAWGRFTLFGDMKRL